MGQNRPVRLRNPVQVRERVGVERHAMNTRQGATTMEEPNADYRVRTAAHKTAAVVAPAADAATADFLQLLGRAVRQFHTYPANSPLCIEAIDACHHAFTALEPGPPLVCRIVPSAVIVDHMEIGRGSIVEQELARPLHRARVAALDIDRAASARDWTQFCGALVRCHQPARSKITLAELLSDAGVTAIVPHMTPRPEVLALGAPPPPLRDLVARERTRRQRHGSGGPVQYFYPPDKGWVLLDPTVQYDSVSLLDLTLLVDDPAQLAGILMRLTDDDDAGVTHEAALEQKYSDVVTLISALDPAVARLLFTRLARAVLDLDSDRRKALLRRAILPGLLDGRVDGEAVLNEFPEVDLAEALCLLLDLETAAPELLSAALDRLNLPEARREALVPLIEAQLRQGGSAASANRRPEWDLDRYADTLVRIDAGQGRSFGEFAAFDLSMNEETAAALDGIRETIGATSGLDAQLACLTSLTRLEPNPALVARFLDRALGALRALLRERRWDLLGVWITRLREIASVHQPARPEIAASIRDTLTRLCDRQMLLEIARLSATGDEEQARARVIVAGLGRAMVPAWLAALESAPDRSRLRPLSMVMAERARELGPAIARSLPHCGADAAPAAVALLGFAGGGYEKVIADQLPRGDERTRREALHALARIGTTEAAAVVVDQLEHGPAAASSAAEDALWHLPPHVALVKARELLGRRGFVTSRPQIAGRLLNRAAQTPNGNLESVLEGLARLRYHFWDPAVMRVATRARELMR
jgi:hypothetical protein